MGTMTMRRGYYVLPVAVIAAAIMLSHPAHADEPFAVDGDKVLISCPEQIELQLLVDYAGKALDVRFIYGEELKNKRVELRPSPVEVPKERLLDLLVSLLRVCDLAMVEESAGFYRIVSSEQTTRSVSAILPADAPADPASLRIVTQVLEVPSGKVREISDKLARFTSSAKGSLVPVPEMGLLIVTDYEARIALLTDLMALLDGGYGDVEVNTIRVGSADPVPLAEQVSAILTETYRVRQSSTPPPAVRGDILAGSVVVIGTQAQVKEA
ncbi:MAG: hypothetical protein JSU63_08295, partial [Phycisphaerales bacterium]